MRIQATTTIVVVRSGATLAPIGRLLSPLTTALTALGAADRMRRSSMLPPRLETLNPAVVNQCPPSPTNSCHAYAMDPVNALSSVVVIVGWLVEAAGWR